mgnify:CR=1 FL=1
MTTRFARRFAGYLTKGDVRRLFYDVLVSKYGSVKRASEEAGIERKTIYNLKEVKDVSFNTKAKVLDAAYVADPLYTLRFLVKTLRKRAGEALFTLIDYIKTEALRCKEPERLMQYIDFLEGVLEELGGPLREEVNIEISDVRWMLAMKAVELGVRLQVRAWLRYYGPTIGRIETQAQDYKRGVAGTLVPDEAHVMLERREGKGWWYSEEEGQGSLQLAGGTS